MPRKGSKLYLYDLYQLRPLMNPGHCADPYLAPASLARQVGNQERCYPNQRLSGWDQHVWRDTAQTDKHTERDTQWYNMLEGTASRTR